MKSQILSLFLISSLVVIPLTHAQASQGVTLSIFGSIWQAITNFFNSLFGSSNAANNQNNASTTLSQVATVPSTSSYVSSCTDQVESAMNVLQDKMPSGSSVSIVNTTSFGVINNNSKNVVVSWINLWESPSPGPAPCIYKPYPQEGCEPVAYYYSGDVQSAANQSMNVTGVAIKIQFLDYDALTNAPVTFVDPLVCGNGNLLSGSKNYVERAVQVTP